MEAAPSSHPLDVEYVDLLREMFWPISHHPRSKTLHLTRPSGGIKLDGISLHKRVGSEKVKDAEQLLAVALRCAGKDLQHRVVHGVFVKRIHRPS